jgi:hypothetical protein
MQMPSFVVVYSGFLAESFIHFLFLHVIPKCFYVYFQNNESNQLPQLDSPHMQFCY